MHLFPSKGHILFHVVQFAAIPVSPPFEISGYGPALTTLSIKRFIPLAAEIICSRDHDVTLGGVAHKSWHLRGVESFAFSQRLARN